MNHRITLFLLALAPLACSSTPKTDTAQPEPAAAPAPAPAPAPVKPIPDGSFALTPTLSVPAVDAAVDFYVKALGAEKVLAMPGLDGKTTVHAEVKIGDSLIYIDQEDPKQGMKAPETLGGTPVLLMVYVDDATAAGQALEGAGAKVVMPVDDQFWGDRYGEFLDPFGHRWAVSTHIEELTPEQMNERAKLAMQPASKKKSKKPAAPAWKKVAGTPATAKRPPAYHTVTPALTVHDGAAAIEFYKAAFGATERDRMPDGAGKLLHAELQIGDSVLILSDEYPEMGSKSAKTLGGSPVSLHHYVTDADAVFARAQAAGGKSALPIGDQFWGDRYGAVIDPFGFFWGVATHKEDVPPEEMKRRAEKMMAEQKPQT